MTRPAVRIRAASAASLKDFYACAPPFRVRAWVVEGADRRVVGVAGLEYRGGVLKAFMDLAPGVEAKSHARTFIHVARRVLAAARTTNMPVLAARDPNQPQSAAFLKHFGFVRMGGPDREEIWRWRNS